MAHRIMIVDDDPLILDSLSRVLGQRDYGIILVRSGQEALRKLEDMEKDLSAIPVSAVLLDLRLPGIGGIETLSAIKKNWPKIPVIMISAFDEVREVVAAIKTGADDYLLKPFEPEELNFVLKKSLETSRLKREVEYFRDRVAEKHRLTEIIGAPQRMQETMELIEKVAVSTDTTVLIEGETGTGKELIARNIHLRSPRHKGPFISLNCAAMPRELIESELFGYAPGAFTGALKKGNPGKISMATGGTIFLDEIAELPSESQAKLLRVLEEKEYYPIGGTQRLSSNVRFIASTNKDLKRAVEKESFRADLYYRLNIARIYLPPLRERKEDILPLANNFLQYFNARLGKKFRNISEEAVKLLLNYPWKGNVRELKNVLERIVLMDDDEVVRPEHLRFLMPEKEKLSPARFCLPDQGVNLEELESDLIKQALERSSRNKTRAAKLLGLSRATLKYRLKKYGIR